MFDLWLFLVWDLVDASREDRWHYWGIFLRRNIWEAGHFSTRLTEIKEKHLRHWNDLICDFIVFWILCWEISNDMKVLLVRRLLRYGSVSSRMPNVCFSIKCRWQLRLFKLDIIWCMFEIALQFLAFDCRQSNPYLGKLEHSLRR